MEAKLRPVSYKDPAADMSGRLEARSKLVLILCYIQVVIGVLCVINQVLCMALHTAFADTAYGLWSGIIFALAGGFGIGAIRNKTTCMIVVFMLFSIIAAVFCVPVCVLVAANEFRHDVRAHWVAENVTDQAGNPAVSYKLVDPGGLAIKKALHVFMIILGLIEGVCAVICSILCCTICCTAGVVGGNKAKMQRDGSVTYQLLLTVRNPREGGAYPREAVITFPEPPKSEEGQTGEGTGEGTSKEGEDKPEGFTEVDMKDPESRDQMDDALKPTTPK